MDNGFNAKIKTIVIITIKIIFQSELILFGSSTIQFSANDRPKYRL
jgi:hypothetical protein